MKCQKKEGIKPISFIASAILGLSVLGAGANVVPNYTTPNEIIVQSNENIINVQWHNNRAMLSNDTESLSLFDKYYIDKNEASRSMDIYIQEEYLPFEEIIPTEYLNDDLSISTLDIGDSQTQEFTHNKGYIKFITKAYALGFYDGVIVYHVEVTTEQQKDFFVNHNDNLIIRHGDNAATLNSYLSDFDKNDTIIDKWDDNIWMTALENAIVNRDWDNNL